MKNKSRAPYIRDQNWQNVYEDKDKDVIFRNYWEKVFNVSNIENLDFDRENYDFIRQQTIDNVEIITPYQTSDLTKLDAQSPLVTLGEIKSVIKSIKQKAPGKSKITKKHITQLPLIWSKNLQQIFNHSLSTGYFPKYLSMLLWFFYPNLTKHHLNTSIIGPYHY